MIPDRKILDTIHVDGLASIADSAGVSFPPGISRPDLIALLDDARRRQEMGAVAVPAAPDEPAEMTPVDEVDEPAPTDDALPDDAAAGEAATAPTETAPRRRKRST